MNDVEALYQFVAAGRWTSALDQLHRAGPKLAADSVGRRAADTLVAALMAATAADPGSVSDDVLEKMLMMETVGLVALDSDQRTTAVDVLVHRHRNEPERALGFARFAPESPNGAAVIAQFGAPVSTASVPGRLDIAQPGSVPEAGRSLFRSAQEWTFYQAARAVFAEMLVYPNVAVSTAIDFDSISGRLRKDERTYFFRAVIDCVVFAPDDGHRPRWFFELDSALHDDLARGRRDAAKDRIITLAGYRLHRIRAATGSAEEFEQLLREAASWEPVEGA